MTKALLLFWIFIFCANCFAQNTSQLQLKTSTFSPTMFTPSTYTPQQPDVSILQRSLDRQQQRDYDAMDAYNKLVKLCQETAKKIPPAEADWFKSYCDSICNEVNSYMSLGYTGSAMRLSYDLMSDLRSNKNILYRIDSYKRYCDDIQDHGLSYYQNGQVTQTAYTWFCMTNPYKFNPTYDEVTSELTGYKPVHVSYLYPSIDWQDASQFITSRGRSKDDIERMWYLYFDFSPDRRSSLRQEFDVTKFCLDYLISSYENPNINQYEKENIANEINWYMKILSDDKNQISFDAFVENLKNQYVIEPIRHHSKSGQKKHPKKKRHSKSRR